MGFVNLILQVPLEMYAAFMAAADNGNIKSMPNRSMPAAPRPTPGALLIGDAVNMRHPLTGGGMTVALSDIVVLTNLLRPLHNLNDAPALCKYLESFYTLRKVSRLCSYAYQILLQCSSNVVLNLFETMFGFGVACGFYHKHIGRCTIQGVLCIL